MTRPTIIRADTIDLQDPGSPSAADHTRQPTQPAPLGAGPASPHQAAAIRHVEEDRANEEEGLVQSWTSPNGTHHDDHSGTDSADVTDDGDMADSETEDMDDDMLDKISSSPSIDDEDIDFEFVYALHTFVATVEGQANATKGDTMVLLDDSNSYWWLVRIVKDSSIGYLPAEHIETPTERLARLNKHRNIDLSAAMLGDSAEKSKNPLKKAMRRRNAKTVQFTAPTYVEASDYDYSSDEEDDDGEDFGGGPVHVEDEQEHEEDDARETMTVEPLRIGGKKDDAEKKSDESKSGDDKARTSDEMFDRPDQKVSRNGTVRNTDSFFKDETVETRKITLTPNLLRDDSSASTVRSEGRERGGSLDSLEKELKSPDSKPKDDKKKKEKKPGMLRGLFGRKDKKAKSADSEQNDEKQSEELARESLSRDSEETASPKEPAKAENESSQQQQQPVRQTNKASKSSEKKTNGPQKSQPSDPNVQPAKSILQKTASQGAAEATMRLVSAGAERNQQAEEDDSEAAARAQGQAQAQAELQARAQEEAKYQAKEAEKEAAREAAAGRARSGSTSAKQAISNILHSKSSEREQKQENKMPPREKVKKSKARAPLDDFDSTPEYEQDDPFADPNEEERQPNGAPQQQQKLRPDETNSRAPESLGDVSPLDTDQPPALMHDTSSQEEPDISPVSPSGSPLRGELSISSPTATRIAPTPGAINTNIPLASANSPTTNELPSAVSLPAWSDASLRSYLDDGSDIRDMLVVVNDTSGVVPVGPEHPIMAGLFSDERSKVAAMGMQLDSLLGDWLSRKRRRNEGGRKQSC
ncbi:hypothetical protein BFW01_g10597 [Lasiodiplodia theobromae]|uniref:SH3 domain-containing protein n=1 Tax=Lasiodiplodia theobromae TaxID=45133 RepID=A0A8H7MAH2_9PEZI|nr:hypothetical protein BFW01_g10597 [Lasiodiplodia theobromae]